MLNRNKAFTIVEMIISMSIMAFFVIALAFSVNKKSQERLGLTTGGYYACYKDTNGNLGFDTEIRYSDTKYNNTGEVPSCVFEVPEGVTRLKVEVVGAGGGAGGATDADISYIENNEVLISSPFLCGNGKYGKSESCTTNQPCVIADNMLNGSAITNTLEDYMEDEVFESLFLNNLLTVVQGGNNLYDELGARCGITRSYNVGDEVLCVNGENESGTDLDAGLVDGNWSSSTLGVLRVNGQNAILAQGSVAYTGYSLLTNTNNSFALEPACIIGGPNVADVGVNFGTRTYSVNAIESITLRRGLAGLAGNYVVRDNVSVSDIAENRVITITPESIGNGGRAGGVGENGEAGTSTQFVIPTMGTVVASGGAGGGRSDYPCVVEKEKISIEPLASREHPYSECYIEGDTAKPSLYVLNELFPKMNTQAQARLTSHGGYCEDDNCEKATVAQNVSYGNGGSAGAVKVVYDYIKQFRLNDNGNMLETPLNEPEFIYSEGVGGSGGAIIFSW